MYSLRVFYEKVVNLFVVLPSSGVSFAFLDGIRAFAVLFVLTTHSWWLSGHPNITFRLPIANNEINITPLFAMMSNGVDLFFVLSGFLLSQAWIRADFEGKPRPSLKKYFKQRFFRIVPAYYACLFLTLLFFTPQLINPNEIYSWMGLRNLFIHMGFQQYNFLGTTSSYNINAPFWTLTIEVMFYLMVPWVSWLFFRNRWMIALPGAIALTIIWLVLCRYSLNPLIDFLISTSGRKDVNNLAVRQYLSTEFPSHLVAFAAGMTAANFVVRSQLKIKQSQFYQVLISPRAGKFYFVAGWLIVLYFMNKLGSLAIHYWAWQNFKLQTDYSFDSSLYYYMERIPFGIGFSLIVAGLVLGGKWLQTCFSFFPLRFIGLIGYSIFLWHNAIIHLFITYPAIINVPLPQRFPALWGAAFCAVVLIATGSFLAIEKPFMLYGRRKAKSSLPAKPTHKLELEMVSLALPQEESSLEKTRS